MKLVSEACGPILRNSLAARRTKNVLHGHHIVRSCVTVYHRVICAMFDCMLQRRRVTRSLKGDESFVASMTHRNDSTDSELDSKTNTDSYESNGGRNDPVTM